jgi:hypothetical protein
MFLAIVVPVLCLPLAPPAARAQEDSNAVGGSRPAARGATEVIAAKASDVRVSVDAKDVPGGG